MLNQAILQQLKLAWQQGDAHDQAESAAENKWHMIHLDSGRFLYQLVRASGARHVLEIGTASGFSTIWLALAADANQGRVTSLDASGALQALAMERLAVFGVGHLVELEVVEAGAWLTALEASPVDFLFLDAQRDLYVTLWPQICRVLRPGGLVLVNHALSHRMECQSFQELVAQTPGYLAETYPIGAGLFVILKDE